MVWQSLLYIFAKFRESIAKVRQAGRSLQAHRAAANIVRRKNSDHIDALMTEAKQLKMTLQPNVKLAIDGLKKAHI